MGRKCSVESCLSDSNRPEDTGVTFHKVPLHSDIRPKWFSLCHIADDKKNLKVIYICSRHFLRADFCNFKGKKYMLRQGVLPSVFPWDKSKLEAIKIKKEIEVLESNVDPVVVKEEPVDCQTTSKEPVQSNDEISTPQSSKEVDCMKIISEDAIKVEEKDLEKKDAEKARSSTNPSMVYSINSRLEALDFNNIWYTARVVEVDYDDCEVLIHFEKFSSKYDEWICMDSPRLRPIQPPGKKPLVVDQFKVGDRCLAAWSDSRKFPATVTKVVENDTYEVLFDDGFVKTLKGNRMSRAQGKQMQSSPLFEPIQSSKQERREKKRKHHVAALFNKRPKVDNSEDKSKLNVSDTQAPLVDDKTSWTPTWENGRPVGTESVIETNDGQRNSIIVADPRLPSGWIKHLTQRVHGSSAGKWDTIIVGPENRRFRTKSEIKTYLENHPDLKMNETMFDFSLHRQRNKKTVPTEKKASPIIQPENEDQISQDSVADEHIKKENANALKIIFEDNAYKCPIQGCGKNFRKENLAQMHVKHYHKEFTKYLDSTPNVADLAYARTVGENFDKSSGLSKQNTRVSTKTTTPKLPKQTQPPVEPEIKCESPTPYKTKDAEIIKLLSGKPFDKKDTEEIQPLPSGLPSNMYPNIKLRDLLSNAEAVPKRDDINLKTLCSTRPPVGIKTLLPVRPAETKVDDGVIIKQGIKRKSGHLESKEIIKGNPLPPSELISQPTPQLPLPHETQHPLQPPNNIIIEGGEVIKIVRMKQEEIINCTCGFTEEDGLMIQCELCLCWQHAYCNNIERESQVPEKYVCYICLNPVRERTSKKYFHDQDWLKLGTLPTGSYHSKDDELYQKRFEKLKKLHDLSGALGELKEFHHSLGVKLKIAEAKNHPKLYLWSKPWDKLPLPEKADISDDKKDDIKLKNENEDHQYIKNEVQDEKPNSQNDSMLMMILKAGKEEIPNINNLMDQSAPIIPRPEEAIDLADCRLNLLDHIAHAESLIEERLDDFERIVDSLEGILINADNDENYSRTRQTLQMLMRDLVVLREFSQITTI